MRCDGCASLTACIEMVGCRHRANIKITRLPESVDGCADCLAVGEPWLHLRICLECGHVGCCDGSPQRHATAHANASGHPLIRSLEPLEEWSWCYIDRIGMLTPEVTGSTHIPPSPMGQGRLSEADGRASRQ
jgi:Zn-finger in ubiquitin-hydrolases and other protein